MTTRLTRRVLRTDSRSGVLALAAALALIVSLTMSFFSSAASAAVLGQNDNVGICHHDNGVKVYNAIAPNVDSIVKASGHDSHSDDIIPSFDYDLGKGAGVQHYPGKNLGLLSTLNNGCVPPPGGPANPTHVTPGTVIVTPSVCAGNPSAPTTPTFSVPSTTGITYSPAAGGTATPGTTVDVTATANAGYVIDVGGVLSPSVVLHATIPAAPTNCTGGGSGNPTTGGNGNPTTGGTLPGTTGGSTPDVNNLGLSKTGTGNAVPGDELVWNVAVTNTSGAAATGFMVTDVLPAGLSYSLAEGPHFTCTVALQTISCTYNGTLAVGQTASISVRALLDSTYQSILVRNIATLDPNRSDSNSADNTSTADTSVSLPTGGGGVVTGGTTGGAVAPPAKPVVKPGTPAAGGGGGGGGGALPFTGSYTSQLAQGGLALLLLGWYLVTVGRRRPVHAR
ncbi:MAG: large repetitive protein [Actinomycetota bacterium]|nr:large repetitive protein [Actinomycetota bacterium]